MKSLFQTHKVHLETNRKKGTKVGGRRLQELYVILMHQSWFEDFSQMVKCLGRETLFALLDFGSDDACVTCIRLDCEIVHGISLLDCASLTHGYFQTWDHSVAGCPRFVFAWAQILLMQDFRLSPGFSLPWFKWHYPIVLSIRPNYNIVRYGLFSLNPLNYLRILIIIFSFANQWVIWIAWIVI